MSEFLNRKPDGFGPGYTAITRIGDKVNDIGMNFGILKLAAGESFTLDGSKDELEAALLLLEGNVTFTWNNQSANAQRKSFFDDLPVALHVPSRVAATVRAETPSELAITQTMNAQQFDALLFTEKNMFDNEHRGKDLLENTAYRMVRTLFDIRNRPQSMLALGEVVNFPGRWSSYPPHHHPQPEIYHYRFSKPNGYGHGECGETVYKVKQYDTLRIFGGNDHAQCSAPGYQMYYMWVVRHLPGCPYTVPEYATEHKWTMTK